MSKIDELIQEFCPNGVKFLQLGDVAQILNGYSFRSGKYSESGIRVVRISDVQKGKMSDKDLKFYPLEYEAEISRYLLRENDLVMSLTGNVGRVAMLSKADLPAGLNQRVACIRPSEVVLTRWLFHFLDTDTFESDAMKNSTGGGQKNMSTVWLSKYKIPVPPLEVQKEIVSILDKFTQLEAELSAELNARQMQYQYYRNQLLTFDESVVPFTDLGDVYKFQYGKGNTIPKAGGEYPVYGSNGVVGSHHEYNSEDAPVIGHIGAYAGIVNWGEGKHFVTYNGVICQIKSGIDDRFGYHLLMKQNLRELARDGSQPFVSYDKLNSVKVQIPDIDTQRRIARILDGFDLLTNGITEGIPAEINARRQQYEYYRTKLLTFQELPV